MSVSTQDLQMPPGSSAWAPAARLAIHVAAVLVAGLAAAWLTRSDLMSVIRYLPAAILPGLVFILPRIWISRTLPRLLFHVFLMAALVLWMGMSMASRCSGIIGLPSALLLYLLSFAGMLTLCIVADLVMPRFSLPRAILVFLLGLLVEVILKNAFRPFTPHPGAWRLILAEVLFFGLVAAGLLVGEWIMLNWNNSPCYPGAKTPRVETP